jgi:hypothetical protein
MTKTPTNTTALETTFVTDEQAAKLVSKVEFALEQLDEVSGGQLTQLQSCCCGLHRSTVSLRTNP